jgi:hypothetical protein
METRNVFNQRRGIQDKAIARSNENPKYGIDFGTLGEFPDTNLNPEDFKNSFVSKIKESPGFAEFYGNAKFADPERQFVVKEKSATMDGKPYFMRDIDNSWASNFLVKYLGDRHMMSPEEKVTRANVIPFIESAATANIKGKFPSEGIQTT